MSEDKLISLTRRQLIGGSIAGAAMLGNSGTAASAKVLPSEPLKIDGRWLIHSLRITRLHVTSTL